MAYGSTSALIVHSTEDSSEASQTSSPAYLSDAASCSFSDNVAKPAPAHIRQSSNVGALYSNGRAYAGDESVRSNFGINDILCQANC